MVTRLPEQAFELEVGDSSITEQQSRLKNDVDELNSQIETDNQGTKKNLTEEVLHLQARDSGLIEAVSNLNKSDSGLIEAVSNLNKSVASIMEDLNKMKKEGIKEASCTTCPSGWIQIGSRCYFFQDYEETWEKSREECAKRDGVLLILRDGAELGEMDLPDCSRTQGSSGHPLGGAAHMSVVPIEFMISLLPAIGVNRYWLGLRRDSADVSSWLWVDGSRVTFSAWNDGEPNNDKDNEHCAEILGGPHKMNDRSCDSKIGYICKSAWTC
ncbi:PREDICTED: C-type lectin mannose-binding isoform-like [Nanorana parkeri]|uniref:C-type lectin mannose-binding isoform-like n=1 Tax=Nanorana parkeri TaxID=125878 RepID=UPI000854083B|nr:PREDICTED: C-type lectin mannose-binding isoform-like [Nanorana parkeri]